MLPKWLPKATKTEGFPRKLLKNGATERSRTADLLITNQLLYQLSYGGISVGNGVFNKFLIQKSMVLL